MPFTELKIDRSFVTAAAASEKHRMMIAHTIEVARLLGLKTVAEGVETKAELQLLKSLGCDMIQGFLIAEPLDGRDLLRWMLARRANTGSASVAATERLFGT